MSGANSSLALSTWPMSSSSLVSLLRGCCGADYEMSAGIACNKLLAKIGSAMNKPNQQTVIPTRCAQHQPLCAALAKKMHPHFAVHVYHLCPVGAKRGPDSCAVQGNPGADADAAPEEAAQLWGQAGCRAGKAGLQHSRPGKPPLTLCTPALLPTRHGPHGLCLCEPGQCTAPAALLSAAVQSIVLQSPPRRTLPNGQATNWPLYRAELGVW